VSRSLNKCCHFLKKHNRRTIAFFLFIYFFYQPRNSYQKEKRRKRRQGKVEDDWRGKKKIVSRSFGLLGHLAVRLGPLGPVVDADPGVSEELPQNEHPGGVEGQVVVELRGHGLEGGESGPGDLGEVVVLVVVPDVEAEDVHEPVVGVRLVAWDEGIVLSEEVAGAGVQTARQEGRHEEVDEGSEAEEVVNHGVEGELHGEVDKVPEAELLGTHNDGAEGVEENLGRAVAKKKKKERISFVYSAFNLPPLLSSLSYQKMTLPSTLLKRRASALVGRSVS